MTEAEERAAVVAEAKTWLRTPYHHRARVKGHGVDCAQLLVEVFSNAGVIAKFDTGEYPNDWMLHRGEERFLGWIEKYARVVITPPLPGDIVMWKYGRSFSHGGIVTSWPEIIHAFIRERCVILGDATKGDLSIHDRVIYRLKTWSD